MKLFKALGTAILAAGLVSVMPADAGIKFTSKDEKKYVKLGGRIQLQYTNTDTSTTSSSDRLRFRRLRTYIEGSAHPDWKGKWQFEFGKEEVEVKDAYFEYQGFNNFKIRVGNSNVQFSRELLTSSKKQQMIERTFVGDHNYGTPDRQPGIHLMKKDPKIWNWGFSLAMLSQDPDNDKLDFESAVSLDRGSDWSDGIGFGGRVEFHPRGYIKMSQGAMKNEAKWMIGLGAFSWSNDDDNLTPGAAKADVDSVFGIEISLAARYKSFSGDFQYNIFNAETVDGGVTSGIYRNSETDLDNFSLEVGYMFLPETFEVVLNYQSQDADNYSDDWTRFGVGLNYFVRKHDIKYMLNFIQGENAEGAAANADVDEIILQAQYVF